MHGFTKTKSCNITKQMYIEILKGNSISCSKFKAHAWTQYHSNYKITHKFSSIKIYKTMQSIHKYIIYFDTEKSIKIILRLNNFKKLYIWLTLDI